MNPLISLGIVLVGLIAINLGWQRKAVADWLAENLVTAGPLRRYRRVLMPFVLMGIGLTFLIESGVLKTIIL